MFFSESFIISGLTFRTLTHFEFIFVFGIRKCFNFILLHVTVQFSQHHLLKRLSLPHCIFLPPLSKIRCSQVCGFMRNSFNLRFPHRLEGIHELSGNCMQHFEFMQFFWEKSPQILSDCKRCLWLRFPKFENHYFTVLSELSNFHLKNDVRRISDSQKSCKYSPKKLPYSFTQIHQLLTFLSLSHTCTHKHTFSLFLNHLTTSFRPDSTSPLNFSKWGPLKRSRNQHWYNAIIQRTY